jgi:hypothetical protein
MKCQAISAWSALSICLQQRILNDQANIARFTIYIAAVICRESSNIGLVVLDFLLQPNAMRNDQANIA